MRMNLIFSDIKFCKSFLLSLFVFFFPGSLQDCVAEPEIKEMHFEKHRNQVELFEGRDNFITHFIHYQILDLKLNQNQFGRKLATPWK